MGTPAQDLDAAFRRALRQAQGTCSFPEPVEGSKALWQQLFTAAATSRQLDFAALRLRAEERGFYTIGSSGHESNAMVALAALPTDPALLHYRSGGFYCARAGQVEGSTPIRDILQGLMGLADEPIAGGRHKVFGHPALSIIPQTSTIGSHLPRAVGLAVALHRARRLGTEPPWPTDAVVICSFGDASANHSTAVGAINTALNTSFRGLPVPILFVCEDNGWGISVPTPTGWIEHAYGSRPGLRYTDADGSDVGTAWPAITAAVDDVRATRRPGFLHLRTVRFLGHAGSDAEIAYRTPTAIEADYARDPLLASARALLAGGATTVEILDRYDAIAAEVATEVDRLGSHPGLRSAEEVMAPLAPRRTAEIATTADRLRPTRPAPPRTLAESINATLSDFLEHDHRTVVFGEDVGVKGGVYGVTRGLHRRFGSARVFDTVLDEQSILGLGLGAGLAGLLPIPEIQYLAYLHNAEDQLRGEAASLQFFSSGAYRNPMVVRIPGLAYQKGFGGHFHNDNGLAVLRDIPGLVIGCPSRGDDAAALLRTRAAAAITDGQVSVIIEPIALYHTRDLYETGDLGWLSEDDGSSAPIGSARIYGQGRDVVMITFGNGVPMSLRVARRLESQLGLGIRVLDLRWLAPLPAGDILREAAEVGRVLVVDETRHSAGVGEGVITALVEAGFTGPMTRVSSRDSFVPLGRAAPLVLLGEDEIEKAAVTLAGKDI